MRKALLATIIVAVLSATLLVAPRRAEAMTVVVEGDYLNRVDLVKVVELVKQFKNTAGQIGGSPLDLGVFFYSSIMQKEKGFDWESTSDAESLKQSVVKLFHDSLMKKENYLSWEEDEGKKKIEQKDPLKISMLKMLHNVFMQTDKTREGEALAWLKKMSDKKWKGEDKSTWTDTDKRTKESMKDYFIGLLEEAILDSVYKDPGGKKDFKMAWLEDWKKGERNEESLKDFVIGTMEQAIQQASQTVRDPSKNAEYFQSKTGKEGKKEVKRELSKATLKEFLLYLKDSQEQFFYDFTQNMWGNNAEKIWEEYKTFDLAKIEKAREDVGKLYYETMKELKEEPTIIREIKKDDPRTKELEQYLRTMGLKLSSIQDCTWGIKVEHADSEEGQCVTIKESGRMIRDPDQFITGEAVKKARDFIMCYFAPWKHFPFDRGGGERDGSMNADLKGRVIKDWDIGLAQKWCPFSSTTYVYEDNYGASCDLEESDKCIPKCSTKYICDWMQKNRASAHFVEGKRPDIFGDKWSEYKKQLCPSDQQKEDLKKSLLFALARRHEFLDTMPPEEWYYGEPKLEGNNPEEWWKEGKNRCDLIMETMGRKTSGRSVEGIPNDLKGQRLKEFLKVEEISNKFPIWIQTGDKAALGGSKNRKKVSSPAPASVDGQSNFAQQAYESVIKETKEIQTMLYKTGEGIAPKHYLLGWKADYRDQDDLYTINTGKIISPAKILTSKIEAAQQAQFDLAMKAWKKQPEGYEDKKWLCPKPRVKEIKEEDYKELKCGKEGDKKLERGWYKVELKDPVDDNDPRLKYECYYPVFNELTCRKFGDLTTEVSQWNERFEELPHELPAPWEDPGEYAKVPDSYMTEADEQGRREPPPDFRRDSTGEKDKAYKKGLWKKFPEIYGDKDKKEGPYPRKKENVPNLLREPWNDERHSEKYYLNKYYKDVTQLYENPMSEVMCEWFTGEDMLHQKDSKVKSTIFQDNTKLKNIIYDYCLPTTEDDYNELPSGDGGSTGGGGGMLLTP